MDYSVQVYMDPQRADDSTSGTAMLVESLSGKVELAGLHKIGLPQGKEIPLYPGARYAVVATLSHADGTRVSYGVDVDVSSADYFISNKIEALAGESYERNNPGSAWKDLVTTADIDSGDERNCTARVRAYTKNADLRSSASLGRTQVAPIPDQPCTGAEIKPALQVTLDGHVLRADTDYALSWSKNVDPGTATVTVTGKGNFRGTASATFTITPAPKPFPDVPENAWYAGVVSRAVGLGLMSGYADGKFGPDNKVTREQLVVMLANHANNARGQAATGSADDYASMADGDSVSPWAVSAVGWCFRNGILSDSNGNVVPQGNVSRAQAAKMVVFLRDMLA